MMLQLMLEVIPQSEIMTMTNDNAAMANDETCRVSKSDLKNIQYRTGIMRGLVEAIGHLDNDQHADALTATIEVTLNYVAEIDSDLEHLIRESQA